MLQWVTLAQVYHISRNVTCPKRNAQDSDPQTGLELLKKAIPMD